MTTTKEMILIGGIISALRSKGSWTGETHVQKASYIAKVRKHVPFQSDFVLYKHGPFSFDLSQSIVHMRGRGVVLVAPNPGYGPSLSINYLLWQALNKSVGEFFDEYKAAVDAVCAILAIKDVAELERVATAVFVSDNYSSLSDDQKAKEINRLKPHIPVESARRAVTEAALF